MHVKLLESADSYEAVAEHVPRVPKGNRAAASVSEQVHKVKDRRLTLSVIAWLLMCFIWGST